MPLMQVTIIPVGTNSTGVGHFITDIIDFIEKQENIEYELNDMGTEIYGSINELFSLAAKIHELPFKNGARRVISQIMIDDRRDIDRKIGEKKQAVIDQLRLP